jgi:hypothetical protein
MSDRFEDPLEKLISRREGNIETPSVEPVQPEQVVVAPDEPLQVPTTSEVPVETPVADEEEDIYGKNDLALEMEEEDRVAAEMRQQQYEALLAQKKNAKSTVMPPQPHDREAQAQDIAFQSNNMAIVTDMIKKVLAKNNITNGEIPTATDEDPDFRMHVMGELMEEYYYGGDEPTPKFEELVLKSWRYTAEDPNENIEGYQEADEAAPDEEKVDPKDQPATININVEGGAPVTVNVDESVVGEMTHTNRVDIFVTEVTREELQGARIVNNSQRDGIITPFRSDVFDTPLTLPLSAYRLVLKPLNYYEFIQLGSSPASGSRVDADKKQWSIIYDHISNVSIGEFKDFEDFMKCTKYMDRELLMWGVLIASSEEEETITIRCGNPKCKKQHQIKYNPRMLIHVNDELIGKYEWETTGAVAPGAAAIAHFNKINSKIRRYKLPNTGYIVEIDDRPSAYDFINRRYPLMDKLRERFLPDRDMFNSEEEADEALNNNPEYSYLLAHAMFVTAISKIVDGTEYRYDNWDDIERIITTSLDMRDAAILLQLVNKLAAENVSPMDFYLENFKCDACGREEKRIPIPDIGNTLIFQLSRRLSSTEINLTEMESI